MQLFSRDEKPIIILVLSPQWPQIGWVEKWVHLCLSPKSDPRDIGGSFSVPMVEEDSRQFAIQYLVHPCQSYGSMRPLRRK